MTLEEIQSQIKGSEVWKSEGGTFLRLPREVFALDIFLVGNFYEVRIRGLSRSFPQDLARVTDRDWRLAVAIALKMAENKAKEWARRAAAWLREYEEVRGDLP